jgi:hypothetical protein
MRKKKREENILKFSARKDNLIKRQSALSFPLTKLWTNRKTFHLILQQVNITVDFHTAIFCIFSDEHQYHGANRTVTCY